MWERANSVRGSETRRGKSGGGLGLGLGLARLLRLIPGPPIHRSKLIGQHTCPRSTHTHSHAQSHFLLLRTPPLLLCTTTTRSFVRSIDHAHVLGGEDLPKSDQHLEVRQLLPVRLLGVRVEVRREHLVPSGRPGPSCCCRSRRRRRRCCCCCCCCCCWVGCWVYFTSRWSTVVFFRRPPQRQYRKHGDEGHTMKRSSIDRTNAITQRTDWRWGS